MTQSKQIRILLVDDHMVVRSGLATVLSAYDDFELVGQAGDGDEDLLNAAYSVVSGGLHNSANGAYATVVGGASNPGQRNDGPQFCR